MCEVQKLLDELCQTFTKFKEMRRTEMINVLNQVRCCECGHKMRLQNARHLRGASLTIKLVLSCFSFLLLLALYMVYVARRYNHVRTYGSSACVSTFFYTYTDCDVFF
ncbi:uncharacterized protein LOC115631914 [Scaptodrosophila lebanonensis]|uniref:Uncharacterized protein LOC115631914 n=1 Tax=Drosophila lebanonensis TaxID=7225 RepID=A0A6J2U9E7_DROLE|nr:uncharacterized protein LOC115631914 [Scaptodrosophila lebanonensis]